MIEQHTATPWFFDGDGKIWRRPPSELYENGGQVAGDRFLAMTYKGWHEKNTVGYPFEANARRIVACVNACEGIPTDVLERNSDTELLCCVGRISQQRDELLAVLKGMLPDYVGYMEYAHGSTEDKHTKLAKELIAKAESC